MVSKVSVKRRAARVRRQIRAGNAERPRLSIYRSGKNIYAQVIDDKVGRTLASASTLDKDLKGGLRPAPTCRQPPPSANSSPSGRPRPA